MGRSVPAGEMSRREWLLRARGICGGLGAVGAMHGMRHSAWAAPAGDIRIACVGDSMIDGIWGGLLRAISKDTCLKGRIALGRYGENGTGLTRSDKYDWAEEVSAMIAEFHPHLVIVSLGLNDRQGVVGPKGKPRTEYGSPGWSRAYSEAVLRFLGPAANTKAGVLWIGVPAMRDKVTEIDAKEKNRLYAKAVETFASPKVGYVEPWHATRTADDVFQAYGLDANGTKIQVRSPDGIHFTAAGYDMVAAYLLPKILAHLRTNEIAIEAPCGK
jgi:hypothetical protein